MLCGIRSPTQEVHFCCYLPDLVIPTFVTLTQNRGSRDDGKRLLSDGRFKSVVLAKQRGEFEGGGLDIGPDRRSRDDGKRPPGLMDVPLVVASRREVEKERGVRGERVDSVRVLGVG